MDFSMEHIGSALNWWQEANKMEIFPLRLVVFSVPWFAVFPWEMFQRFRRRRPHRRKSLYSVLCSTDWTNSWPKMYEAKIAVENSKCGWTMVEPGVRVRTLIGFAFYWWQFCKKLHCPSFPNDFQHHLGSPKTSHWLVKGTCLVNIKHRHIGHPIVPRDASQQMRWGAQLSIFNKLKR